MSVCNKPENDLSYKMLNEKKTNVKCVIVGDAMVGKTSLARRLACLGFATDYNPTTFDNYVVLFCARCAAKIDIIFFVLERQENKSYCQICTNKTSHIIKIFRVNF
ncbi:cell division control protein 42 [Plakobranchus ocellatus]|uniref:Cell division control protein 42 n=1 Tax=Plakobranchus ocellatus TaxID=259542 RepID=A0AAV3ZRQ2_9GAST|nr:cell division control protein 42 [Plakobranchus ocellatus]